MYLTSVITSVDVLHKPTLVMLTFGCPSRNSLWITSIAFQHMITCEGNAIRPNEFQKVEAPFSCQVPMIALEKMLSKKQEAKSVINACMQHSCLPAV